MFYCEGKKILTNQYKWVTCRYYRTVNIMYDQKITIVYQVQERQPHKIR